MNKRLKELYTQVCMEQKLPFTVEHNSAVMLDAFANKFAELIVLECIDKIETHCIPVGNSAAGEMACEWTYAALKEIRDEIKEHFGVEE
jgi:hypothetical protein